MKLLNFNIIKLTLSLIVGITIAHFVELPLSFIVYSVISSLALLFCVLIYNRKRYKRPVSFGILALLSMVLIGIFTHAINDETLRKNHYTNLNYNRDKENTITFQIKKRLKPDLYNDKYIARVLNINSKKTSGQILLNLKQDSLQDKLNVDDVYVTVSNLVNVQKPLNPFQFNYNAYLKQRNIHHQVYLNFNDVLPVKNSKASIFGYADVFRHKVNTKLKASGFDGDALSIINALLLGQRQDIDKDTYNNYVNAGTIHILAVSGLHVGIILMLLNFLFKPVEHIKYGRFIKPFIIVVLLWTFAIIAGLSASVTRAVAMFSIIAIAMHLKRPTNIYNTLTISVFFILLVQPTFLFDVGFQMSYLAVIAIVSIQPLLYKLWRPKYYITDKLWQIFTVTLAAQLGVAPVSLFYFHQFPGLFFVSNIVIIPFLGFILGFGILIIALVLLNGLPKFLVDGYTFIIDSLNAFIGWVAQFESFLLKDIPFNIFQVISAYILTIAAVRLLKNKSYKALKHTMLGVALFLCVMIFTKFKHATHEFIIFNKSRHSVLAEKTNDRLDVFHNLDSALLKKDKTIKNYKVGSFIDIVRYKPLKSVYVFNNKKVLVVDSLGVYNITSFKPDYIVLTNSPQLNLKRVIDSLKPIKIIADASNYKSYLKRWKATCQKQNIPFHQTNEKGYYSIK